MSERFRRHAPAVAAAIGILALWSPPPCRARSYEPWQATVANAEFIGIAECTMAGLTVAEYRVVESWKGPSAGTIMRIAQSTGTDFGVSMHFLSIAGERYLVVAGPARLRTRYADPPPLAVETATSVEWRRLPVDYYASLLPTPLSLLDATEFMGGPGVLAIVTHPATGSGRERLAEFHHAVRSLAGMNERRLELEALRASAQWVARGREPARAMQLSDSLFRVSPLCAATSSQSLGTAVADLIRFGRRGAEEGRQVLQVFSAGGGHESNRRLAALNAKGVFLDAHGFDEIVRRRMRWRIGLDSLQVGPSDAVEHTPSEPTLREWRARVDPDSAPGFRDLRRLRKEFEGLTRFEPDRVAAFLRRYTASPDAAGDLVAITLSTYFGTYCPRDRERLFTSLLRASDPTVRVAGAVYLTFENEAAGRAALHDLARLPGDPGVWAALSLARRGEKNAVPRALEVLRESAGRGVDHMTHGSLQGRVIALLSNSAISSGIALPITWDPEFSPVSTSFLHVYSRYVAWWQANAAKIRLVDPWMPMLAADKRD